MFKNSMVPYTIVKERNGDPPGNQQNQYKWQKKLESPGKLSYLIENITLAQEPTEKLNMSVTLLRSKCKCQAERLINCTLKCRVISVVNERQIYCPSCGNNFKLMPKSLCLGKKSIAYVLKIDFHNYLHEFSSSYSYEVVCKIPRVNKPDDYLFTCVESRKDKEIVFEKCYASTTFNDTFNLSSPTLYFGIRRLNNHESEISNSTLLSVISTFQNIDDKEFKVIIQAKDGQITAHKSVLSQYSDVFRAMFADEMKEKQDGVVGIPDVEFKVIKKLVDYLYTGKLENITGMAEELFKVAHRYQIQDLCRRCEEYYIFTVQPTNDNIVEILQLVDIYELKELKNSADKFVHCHEKVLTTLPRYQKYLCESVNIAKATGTLISADKYSMKDVKTSALNFIKLNFGKMVKCNDFLELFETNPRLMKEVYIFCFQDNI